MKQNNLDTVYGVHPIIEIIQAKKRKIYELFIAKKDSPELSSILRQIPSYTKITYCDKKKIEYLAQTEDHQSIAAFVSPFIYKKEFFNPLLSPMIVLFDSVQDTKNFGALLRSCYCTNICNVIIPEKAAVDITGAVLKSSAGLAEYISLHKAKSSLGALQEAKKKGYTIYLAAANGQSIEQIIFQTPCCLVIGNEHSGIEKKLFPFGEIVSLKQKNQHISYNASVAGGILLYHIANQMALI